MSLPIEIIYVLTATGGAALSYFGKSRQERHQKGESKFPLQETLKSASQDIQDFKIHISALAPILDEKDREELVEGLQSVETSLKQKIAAKAEQLASS